jgi:hypothetical protein
MCGGWLRPCKGDSAILAQSFCKDVLTAPWRASLDPTFCALCLAAAARLDEAGPHMPFRAATPGPYKDPPCSVQARQLAQNFEVSPKSPCGGPAHTTCWFITVCENMAVAHMVTLLLVVLGTLPPSVTWIEDGARENEGAALV